MSEYPGFDREMFQFLFRVTDDMHRLKVNPGSISCNEYAAILNSLCGALHEAFDHGLEKVVYAPQVIGNDPVVVNESQEIVADMGRFSEFIQIEKQIWTCPVFVPPQELV